MRKRAYRRFAERRRAELHADGSLAATAVGTIEFQVLGPADGRPVLFFHGGPGGHEQVSLVAPLAEAGCRLVGWSRPGYLRTPLDAGRTCADQGDAAAALLDALGVEAVVAYAISGGGPSAIEFARRHPARVDRLVLESAISGHYDPDVPAVSRALYLSPRGAWLMGALGRRWPRTAIAAFVKEESTLDRATRRRTVDWILADERRLAYAREVLDCLTPYEDRSAGLANDLRQWATLDDSLTEGVTCPTLVLHGTHDGDADPAHARHAAATIPGATLHLVDGGWHLLELSLNGAAARAAVREFIG